MTQREKDFKELEDLKQQFALLDEKLDKQRIISEEIVGEAIKEKLSHIERWYRKRFSVSLVSAPIVGIVFLVMYLGKGAGGFMRVFSVILLLLVGVVFVVSPADILSTKFDFLSKNW